VIEERKIIIELDGKHHFEQIGKWISPEETRKMIYKMKYSQF
jgi:very-short-patch-repair endonuclease